jgi:SAM-dependent methyltransferase
VTSPPRLFDRDLIQRRLAQALAAATPGADFLLVRAAHELADRLTLVKREFTDAADVGTPGPYAYEVLSARAGGRTTLRVDDVEHPRLEPQSLDLVVSLHALHFVDDLPGALIQLRQALRPDGLLIAALAGGDTLTELRQALTIAESDIAGGVSPRIIPFADVRAMGGLLQRAGLALPVVDADRANVRYPDIFALMRDLKAFGAANPLAARLKSPTRREVFLRAQQIYQERFADPDGRLRATFDTLWISGWAPHGSQQQALKPGSAKMRLRDVLGTDKTLPKLDGSD